MNRHTFGVSPRCRKLHPSDSEPSFPHRFSTIRQTVSETQNHPVRGHEAILYRLYGVFTENRERRGSPSPPEIVPSGEQRPGRVQDDLYAIVDTFRRVSCRSTRCPRCMKRTSRDPVSR
jgi:hypothetical protein